MAVTRIDYRQEERGHRDGEKQMVPVGSIHLVPAAVRLDCLWSSGSGVLGHCQYSSSLPGRGIDRLASMDAAVGSLLRLNHALSESPHDRRPLHLCAGSDRSVDGSGITPRP